VKTVGSNPRARSKAEEKRIKRIKRMIQQGEYESPDKLDIALERLLEDLSNYDEMGQLIREDENGDESP